MPKAEEVGIDWKEEGDVTDREFVLVSNSSEQKARDKTSSLVDFNKVSNFKKTDRDGILTTIGPNKDLSDVGIGLNNT